MFSLIGMLVVGLVAGWAASQMMGAKGAGVLSMLVVGVIGSYIGPALLWMVGFKKIEFPASLIAAILGAIVCIVAIRYFGPKF